MKSNLGFTLVEILVVIFIISIGIGLSYSTSIYIKENAKLDKTIKEAQLILKYADMVRQRSSALTIGTSPPAYEHARPVLPPGDLSLADIEMVLNLDTGLSLNNPWGHQYRIRIADHYSRLVVDVDVDAAPVEAQSFTSLGVSSTQLVFINNGQTSNRLLRAPVDSFKKHFYLEDIR